MAPVVQTASQALQSTQSSGFVTLAFLLFTSITLTGQAFTHSPQPEHFSWSILGGIFFHNPDDI
jgi:hypothetical protein